MPEGSNGGRWLLSTALKSMNHATAASGGIAARRATSLGGPPKPARSSKCRACSRVQSEAPIGDRSSCQPSVMAYPPCSRHSPDDKLHRWQDFGKTEMSL